MAITPIRKPWKGTMTDRERFNRQMHYQSVDRCFNMEFGYWEENFSLWDIFVKNNVKTNHEADILFAFDKISVIGGNIFMHPHMQERTVEIRANTKVIMNSDGLMAEVPLEGGGSSVPHYLESSIKTPEDWKRIKEEHFNRKHPDRKINIAKLKERHLPDKGRD